MILSLVRAGAAALALAVFASPGDAQTPNVKFTLDFAMVKMQEEDPTFRVKDDPETGQTIISGMGELHLEIIVDRMKREYGVQARAGKPQVVYRETVLAGGEGTAEFERDLKEQAIYGLATCKVQARARGTGMEPDSNLLLLLFNFQ